MSELVVAVRVDDGWFKVGVLVGKILRSTINFAECEEMEGLKWTACQSVYVSLIGPRQSVVRWRMTRQTRQNMNPQLWYPSMSD